MGSVSVAEQAPLVDRRPGSAVRNATRIAAIAVALVVGTPLLYLVVRASSAGPSGIASVWLRSGQLALVMQTIGLIAGVVALANLIALPAAWLVARSDLRARPLWATALALPLVIPSYVSAFAWVSVVGPRGLVQDTLQGLGVERLPAFAYGYSGALFSLALFTYPYIFLPLVAAFRSNDTAAEESARALGSGPWRTFFRVTLPRLRAPLASGSLLVALYTLSDFGAVSIVRFNTLTLGVYNAYRSLFDRTSAAVVALQLAVLALILVGIHGIVRRGARRGPALNRRPVSVVPLGRWRGPATTGLAGVALLNLGIPLLAIGVWMTRPGALREPMALVLGAFHSVSVSAAAALAAVLLAFPLAVWASRFPGAGSRWVERLSHAGFAMPGLVVALSLVFLATRQMPWVYQTLGLLVVAYVVRFLPESLGATRNALHNLAPGYEEAARNLGCGRLETFRRVTWPLIRPGVLAGGALVFMTAMKELPATLILRPIGYETLATSIWSAASEGLFAEAALPALCLLVAGAVPVYRFSIRPTLDSR